MKAAGNILKMRTKFLDEKIPESMKNIQYYLPIGDELVFMNELIGKKIQLVYEGLINCVVCGKRTKKSCSFCVFTFI